MSSIRSKSRRNKRDVDSKLDKMVASLQALTSISEAKSVGSSFVPDIPRMQLKDKQVCTKVFSTVGPTITTSTSGSTFGGLSFYLASFDNTSEITEEYQMFRIIQATVKFIPAAKFVATTSVDYGNIYTCVDYTSDAAPVSIAEVEQYKNKKVYRVGEEFERTWTPNFLIYVYGSASNRRMVAKSRDWLVPAGAALDDQKYYGLRWAVGQSVGTSNGQTIYSTNIEIVVQAKHPK